MDKDIRMKIAITGQRPASLDKDYTYTSDLWKFIYQELESTFNKMNPQKIYSGLALGVDTVAAEIAVKMKIPFVASVPFAGQEDSWSAQQQGHYNLLKEYADSVVTVSPGPVHPGLYQVRNQYMVDNADIVVAVWNGWKGGTRNCIEYALKQQVPVWRIDPSTRKVGRYDGSKIIQKSSVSV